MNTKSRILLLLFWGLFINIAFMGAVSASTVNVTSTMNNSQIQSVLDNASSGDTINFLGQFYENIQLTVSKSLNIISYVGTTLSGSGSSDSVVFLINGPGASGTTISGFNITNSDSSVIINNTRNVALINNSITSNDTAVTINSSSGTYLKNNNITNSTTGINLYNSKNTTITKNKVTNNTNGVTITNSADTTLKQDNISDNAKNGVEVYNSVNTIANDSDINNNKNNGFEISKSNRTLINSSTIKNNKADGVHIKSSDKFKISSSEVSNNYNGVSLQDVSNATIRDNNITGNYMHGILLSNTVKTSFITNNIITENGNGIRIDCIIKNLTINGNIITNSIERSGTDREQIGHGVSFGGIYMPSKTLKLEHNIITLNQHRDIDSHDTCYTSYVGSNFYGANAWICGAITTETHLVLIRTGEDTYIACFVDGDTGEIESDFPVTPISFNTINSYMITVSPENGGTTGYSPTGTTNQGYITLTISSGSRTGTLTATSYGISETIDLNSSISSFLALSNSAYTDWTVGLTIPADPDRSSGGNSNGNGSSGGTSNNGSGTNSNNNTKGNTHSNSNNNTPSSAHNGTISSSIPSIGALAATSAAESAASPASQAGSNGAGTFQPKTAKELFMDNTTNNATIWGVIGIILLIVIIFGAYYRNDLMNMIKRSKK